MKDLKIVKDLRGHLHVVDKLAGKGKKVMVMLTMTMLFVLTICSTVLASTGGTTPTLDEGVFTTLFNGCKTFLGLFTIFPINIFLGASLVGVIVMVIKKFKN